jgi:hypothetical protein
MADEKIERPGAGAESTKTRRPWVEPKIQDMMAGDAELGGDISVDGDPGFS